jgi:hypothetical protein
VPACEKSLKKAPSQRFTAQHYLEGSVMAQDHLVSSCEGCSPIWFSILHAHRHDETPSVLNLGSERLCSGARFSLPACVQECDVDSEVHMLLQGAKSIQAADDAVHTTLLIAAQDEIERLNRKLQEHQGISPMGLPAFSTVGLHSDEAPQAAGPVAVSLRVAEDWTLSQAPIRVHLSVQGEATQLGHAGGPLQQISASATALQSVAAQYNRACNKLVGLRAGIQADLLALHGEQPMSNVAPDLPVHSDGTETRTSSHQGSDSRRPSDGSVGQQGSTDTAAVGTDGDVKVGDAVISLMVRIACAIAVCRGLCLAKKDSHVGV